MKSLCLRYGLNPHQAKAELAIDHGSLPITVLSGAPSYINLLDAIRGWRLVRELRQSLVQPAAASYKHVNPAGVGLGSGRLDERFKRIHFLGDWKLSPLAIAYLRARQADRISSYGDLAALSDVVDVETASVLKAVASDGVIAPGFHPDALSILRSKRDGRFLVLEIDPCYQPMGREIRGEFGLKLVQDADRSVVPHPRAAKVVTSNRSLDETAAQGLLLAMIVAKHTQSNGVVIATEEQTLGIGAGQQSRIAATKIACDKAESYLLYEHPKVCELQFSPQIGRVQKMNAVEQFINFETLSDDEKEMLATDIGSDFHPLTYEERRSWIKSGRSLYLASDAVIPFRDNIDRAARLGVTHLVQTGGSIRDADVTAAADRYGMLMLHTGIRHFLH